MRLVRLTTNYPAYLQQLYASHPGLGGRSYREQHSMLMEDCFGWVDYWKRALEKHGYAVWDLIGNAEMLQKVWSKEHGINYAEDNWLKEIVAAQITHYKPEVLFVNDYNIYPASFLRQIRQNCTSIKLVVGWCGAPYRDAGIFSECDIVLTNIARVVEDLRGAGVVAEKMHHAFAPILLDRVNRNKDALSDFVFIGSVFLQDKFHIKRAQILADLLETTDIEIWGQVGAAGLNAKAKGKPGIRGLVRKIYEGMNGKRGNGEFTEDDKQNVLKLRAHIRSPVYGLQMFEKLHNSRITFNSHIDISLNESSNMRLFEATGVGSCLMTENSKNITEIFDPDTEVVTYENATDAAEKVVYLLENEDLRKRIAGAGQRRTLRDHNFDVRAQAMNELIRVRLA